MNIIQRSSLAAAATGISLLLASAPAIAVTTSYWTHTTETDFTAGKFDRVVVTNRGELKLARQAKAILENNPNVAAVHALAEDKDGSILVGSGPEGLLLKLSNGKSETLAEFGTGNSITALAVRKDGAIFAGVSGESGKIHLIQPGKKPVEYYTSDTNQYIWKILCEADGTLVVATGPFGKIVTISPQGEEAVLFQSDESNFTALIDNGKGQLIAGSDPNGLIYRIDRKSGQAYVMYDAAESEISALAMDSAGNLYAGTAETAAPGAETTTEQTDTGHPDHPTTAPAIQDAPPTTPAPMHPTDIDAIPADPTENEPPKLLILDELQTTMPESKTETPGATPTPAVPTPGAPGVNGNAVYKIDPEGFVSEIFRKPVTIYAIIEENGNLLIGTGPEGAVYSLNPAAEETGAVARLESPEATALLRASDGRILAGGSNAGIVAELGKGLAAEGIYTSPALDAAQVARFGKLQLNGTIPAGCGLKISTRSGNVQDVTIAGWSEWSEPQPAAQFIPVASAPARFLQYRLTMTGNGTASPLVGDVKIAYQPGNRTPQIKAMTATPKSDPLAAIPESHVITLAWEAVDQDSDAMRYDLHFRTSRTAPWVLLKDKLTEATYEWDTRGVADGRYELRVTASDVAANALGEGRTATRLSEAVIVDNTPPAMGDVRVETGKDSVTLHFRAADQTSTVAKLEYSVDSSTDWQTALPLDKMADSPEETYKLLISSLSGGVHQIAVRATDGRGNVGYQNVTVTIAAPEAAK